MIKGSRLIIEKTLLRFDLSYSNSENNFKRKLDKALTLENIRKCLEKIIIVKLSETRV